jgi:aromatic aminotransferase
VLEALSPLGPGAVAAGDAAIYFLARLPHGTDDEVAVARLIREFKVTTIPGSACGMPGHIRVAYANCTAEECAAACMRLKAGLEAIVRDA